jgi:hypothetical protein
MALLYKHNESHTVVTRSVTRPGFFRVGFTIGILGTRLCSYLLIARIVGVQTFGLFLLMQWLAYAPLPLLGIGIDPLAWRRIANLQGQEPEYGAARIFRFLLHRQCRRAMYYAVLYIPLAYVLSFASKGLLPLLLLLIASLAALPLLMSSVVGIALQSQGRFVFLSSLSVLNALLTLSLVSLVPLFSTGLRMDMLLLIPTLAYSVILAIAMLYLRRLLPLREALPVGPLLKQKLIQAAHVSPLHFFTDVFIWRELPLLVLLSLLWHSQTSLIELSFYAFSLLLCTRLIEVAPTCFITCLLPLCSHLYQRFMKRSLSHGPYDAFIQATCYVSLLASILCTLLTFLCPQLILGTVVVYIILMIPCIALWGMNGAALASMLVRVGFALGSILQCHRLLRTAPSLSFRLPIAS